MSEHEAIVPVILSGGSGTRLWPMSRPERPKQMLALTADETMLQLTAQRAPAEAGFGAPIVVANALHADMIEQQLGGTDAIRAMILEPMGRNTAPAIALAALAVDGSAPLLVMPSDHVIADIPAFHAAIEAALPAVRDGWMATFGISPDHAETGYGYIRVGEAIGAGIHRVARFVEKPERAAAEAMVASGDYVWNGGIFLFRADVFIDALAEFAPEMLAAARAAMERARVCALAVRLDRLCRHGKGVEGRGGAGADGLVRCRQLGRAACDQRVRCEQQCLSRRCGGNRHRQLPGPRG